MKIITPQEGYFKATTLCSRGEQCTGDILDKLKRWGIADVDAAAIISRLIEERYIDNERFARAYCRDKARFQSWGKRKIIFNLRQKGVSQEIIDDALTHVEDETYSEKLETTLRNKFKTIAGKDPYKVRASLYRHAASRGFESQEIMQAISKIMNVTEDDDDFTSI